MNVGFQGQSGSNADIAEPSLLTQFGNGEPSEPNFYLAGRAERPEYSRHFWNHLGISAI